MGGESRFGRGEVVEVVELRLHEHSTTARRAQTDHSDFDRPLATHDAFLLITATCGSSVFAPFSVTGALSSSTFTLTRSCSPSLVILAVPGAALGSVFDELHGVAALLDVGEVQLATACELRLLTPAQRGEGRCRCEKPEVFGIYWAKGPLLHRRRPLHMRTSWSCTAPCCLMGRPASHQLCRCSTSQHRIHRMESTWALSAG